MATQEAEYVSYSVPRLTNASVHQFSVPVKKINDGDDLQFWLTSTAYRDLTQWLMQLNRSMFPTRDEEGHVVSSEIQESELAFSHHVESVRKILASYEDLVARVPPKTGPRRFGNVAFRDWYKLVQDCTLELLREHLKETIEPRSMDEIAVYLLGSFGSSQRLDYGTGHELSFVAFLACLWKLGLFTEGDERTIVTGIIQPYLRLMRMVISTYTLEPAGSHGVWGLDDHSFVPYIFGSAQFGPPIGLHDNRTPVPTEGSLASAPPPSAVTKRELINEWKERNMYFSAIDFIYEVKKGPFWEHSPVLYDISGIKDGWGKINKGMLKMYAAEVLGKFPVVQHFPFGSLFEWEQDKQAAQQSASVHAQQQPASAPPLTTRAPTAFVADGRMHSSRVPTHTGPKFTDTRPPWATTTQDSRMPPNVSTPSTITAASRSSTPRSVASSDMPVTKAPWARKE